eukprot:TRINITY_DN65008_c0_g1_i2.p1 TRINITY_DN65008_c0_g1~~TRINITY_DN65008_c0_g1_i2.p1  ORF type:complete len:297 (-),score=26.24 TRINITY_DN65008_c0_g1_i2:12-902(-)
MKSRVDLIAAMTDQVVSHDAVDVDPKTLKVLMCPEYFFARRTRDPATDAQPEVAAKRLWSLLQDVSKQAAGSDWLFVFGTIAGFKQLAKPKLSVTGELRDFDPCGAAIIMQGGSTGAASPPLKAVVTKQFMGGLDFVLSNPEFGSFPCAFEVGAGPSAFPGLCTLANVAVGLEICMDHTMCSLKNTLLFSGGLPPPQVQLVTSAGMTIKDDAVCVADGGVVFQCDGITRDGSIVRASSTVLQKNDTGMSSIQPLVTLSALDDNWQESLGQLFLPHHRPRISVYTSVDLPQDAAVKS